MLGSLAAVLSCDLIVVDDLEYGYRLRDLVFRQKAVHMKSLRWHCSFDRTPSIPPDCLPVLNCEQPTDVQIQTDQDKQFRYSATDIYIFIFCRRNVLAVLPVGNGVVPQDP